MSDPNNPGSPSEQPPTPGPGYPPPPPAYPTAPAAPYGSPPPLPAYGAPTPYAHWGLRLAGYLLDTLLLIPGYIVGGVGQAIYDDPASTTSAQNTAVLLMVVGYAAAAVFAIWNQILRQGRTGQSLGKKWVGIRLVKEADGRPLGGWLTFGRALLHILDGLPCYLGYLWPLWDAKRQTFADKIVSSVVVRTQTPVQVPAGQTW